MGSSGIQVNKALMVMVLLIIGVTIIYIHPYVFRQPERTDSMEAANREVTSSKIPYNIGDKPEKTHSGEANREDSTTKIPNIKGDDPDKTHSREANKEVSTTKIPYIQGNYTVNIYTQRVFPNETSKGDVLFLHGQRFSSQTWIDLKTMSLVAELGYNAVAIDFPGTPFSKSDKAEIGDKNKFLEDMVSALKLKAPVIVSPSLSGKYSLPYLFSDLDHVLERASGFVPIVPINAKLYSAEQYEQLKIPAAVVYGEKYSRLKMESVESLKNLPCGKLHEIKGTDFAPYLEKPGEFHAILTDFLKSVYS